MARSSGGRPVRSSHPSWPPLRVRALVNGLISVLAGAGLLWLTWGALDFTVYDASDVPAVVRVIALWMAVGMPIAWLAIGLHLIVAGILGGDRVLLAHGAAEWEPSAHDDVLRGVRVRSWRLGLLGGRRISARTLGWLPELSPYSLAPLAGGILTLLIMIAWMARGYGAGVIALIVAILWLGWRLLRGWQAWTDVRDHRSSPRRAHDAEADDEDPTPDEGWDPDDDGWADEDPGATAQIPRQRPGPGIAATRRVDHEGADDETALLPLYVDDDRPRGRAARREPAARTDRLDVVPEPSAEPMRRGRRRTGRSGGGRDEQSRASDDGPPEMLVDRSVQRAIRAKQARRGGAEADPGAGAQPPRGRPSRRRGRQRAAAPAASEDAQPRGLRSYLGERSHQGQEDSGTRSLRGSADAGSGRRQRARAPQQDEPFDQDRPARGGGGAPSAAAAMEEIYGRDDHAPSLLSYLSRRRDDDRRQ